MVLEAKGSVYNESRTFRPGNDGFSLLTKLQPRLPRTVRGTLVLLLIVVLAPLVLLESVMHYNRFQERRSQALAANLELARATENAFDLFVEDILRHELVIGGAIDPQASAEQIDSLLHRTVDPHPSIIVFQWRDLKGNVVASSDATIGHVDFGQGFFDKIANDREWTVSDLLLVKPEDRPAFAVVKSIRDRAGSARGLMMALVDPEGLDEALAVRRAGDGTITIHDNAGTLVYKYPSAPLSWSERRADDPKDLIGMAAAGDEVAGDFLSVVDGVSRIGAFVPIHEIDWVAGAGTPSSDVIDAALQDLRVELVYYVLTITVGVLLALLLGGNLTRPLARLRDRALEIGEDKLAGEVRIEGPNELVALGAAFNKMAKEIEVRQAELEEHVELLGLAEQALGRARDDLEARVEQRTAELARSEARFRSVVQTAVNGVIQIDSNGAIVLWNRGAERILGYTPDEVVGKPFTIIAPEQHRAMHQERLTALLALGEPQDAATFESVAQRKDGRQFPAEMSLGSWKINELFFTCIVRDISLTKKAQDGLQESIRHLEQTLERSVQAMALMGETRDPYTAGHQRRVAELAAAMAEEMKLSPEEIRAVRMAGVVHDIGKIAIPAEILVKPTRISQLEFDLIKAHPQIGYEFLKTIEFPWPIAEMVRQHHERLDGSGYPAGLKGDDILLGAKILAVADVVEAMASYRPYRPALGIGEALGEIELNCGSRYDRDVVRACLVLFKEHSFGWSA